MTAESLLLGGHVAPQGQLAGPRGMVPAAGDFSNAGHHTRLWFLEPRAVLRVKATSLAGRGQVGQALCWESSQVPSTQGRGCRVRVAGAGAL